MKCTDIYCKIAARKRLKEQGCTNEEAREISDDVYNKVKKAIDKNVSR